MSLRPKLKTVGSDSYYRSDTFNCKPATEEALLPPNESGSDRTLKFALAPWKHSPGAMAGLGIAVLLQALLFGFAVYLTLKPIVLPVGLPIFGNVSLKKWAHYPSPG